MEILSLHYRQMSISLFLTDSSLVEKEIFLQGKKWGHFVPVKLYVLRLFLPAGACMKTD